MTKEIRVLVVDDEVAVCNSCIKTFSREGYQVDYSLNGEDALKKIALVNYDLVVTDLKMPKVDGMQLLKTVKARWPEINVIMITGYGNIRSAVESIKLGAFDYISKPFTSEELAGVAARALGLTQIYREEEKPILYFPVVFSGLKAEDMNSMWCIPEHAWVRVGEDHTVRIGLDAIYRRLIGGDITNLEFPQMDKQIKQGEVCARITVQQGPSKIAYHNLWCPVGGTVAEINQEVQKDLSLLAMSPYSRGWLVRLVPSNLDEDIKNLKPFKESIGGKAAQRHLIHPIKR